jgi:4-amino-4-deoxy-L-arabinose transferase-like glycosyltransferase
VLGHLPFLGSPFVNLESWFARAAQDLLRGDPIAALRTFEVTNANPLFSVAGIVPFIWLLGPSEMAARIFSLGCAAGTILVVGCMAKREFGPAQGALAAIFAALNPVLWTWGGFAYSDGPFVFLISASLALTCSALRNDNGYLHACSATLLGLAFLTKYNAVAAFTGTIVLLLLMTLSGNELGSRSPGRVVRVAGLYMGIGLLIGGPYLLWVYNTTGHVLSTAGNVTLAGNNLKADYLWVFLARLAACVMWLGIIVGPLALLYLPFFLTSLKRSRGLLFLAVMSLVMNDWLVHQIVEAQDAAYLGEMQLGWLANVGHPLLVHGLAVLLLTIGELTLILILRWDTQRPCTTTALKVWVMIMLLIHASVRPTQRYLLFLVPVVAPFLADLAVHAWEQRPRLVVTSVVVSIAAFLSLGFFNSAYFAAEGHAAAAVAQYVNEHRLVLIPNSPIHPVMKHNFYLIDPDLFVPPGSSEAVYDLAAFMPHEPLRRNIVHAEEVRLMGMLLKRYAVIRFQAGIER